MRTLATTIAAVLALAVAIPATASARNPRPTEAQATAVAQRIVDRAAEGLRSTGLFDVEAPMLSCGHPFGSGPRSLTCRYSLYFHSPDGSSHICMSSVSVSKARTSGRLSGRAGTQTCF